MTYDYCVDCHLLKKTLSWADECSVVCNCGPAYIIRRLAVGCVLRDAADCETRTPNARQDLIVVRAAMRIHVSESTLLQLDICYVCVCM